MNTSVVSQNLDRACLSFRVPHSTLSNKTVLQDSRSSFKARVYVEHIDGACIVVKDYSHAHPLIRASVCKWLIAREVAALLRLDAHRGVPIYKGKHGKFAFAMQLIEGHTISKSVLRNNPSLVEQLIRHIQEMHSCGVTHNDLRVRNVLIDQHHNLHVIDFAGAIIKSKHAYTLPSLLYYLTKFIECVKLVRIKQQIMPQELNTQEKSLVKFVLPLMQISRLWKKYVKPSLR